MCQYVIRNKAPGNLIRYNTAFYESSSGAIFELYQNVETVTGGGDIPVEIEVRKQDYFGSVNITNDITTPIIPPIEPSTVLFGLISGANLVLPNLEPTKNANVSLINAPHKTYNK